MASSSDRARGSVPEQYRTRFDQLRNGILAFCQEFHIPSEALKSIDIFGNALSSHAPRIPLKEIERVSLLFRRLEHLLVHKELWKDEEALREAERRYRLKEQYATQVRFLKEVGILNEHNAILGIDGKEYPIPTLEQIAERLCDPERREFFETKQDQGFTKLLLVPFGMSLDTLRDTFEQFLFTYKQTQHPTFPFDNHIPLSRMDDYVEADIADPPNLIYHPTIFDKDRHQGKTKQEILEEQEQDADAVFGWRIHLFQVPHDHRKKGFREIPREGKGREEGVTIVRPDLEMGKTPDTYLSILKEASYNPASPYYGEFGMTPEDWIIASMVHLRETKKPLDHYGRNEGVVSYLIGSFFTCGNVPHAYWGYGLGRANLEVGVPHALANYIGVRTSVIV